ncbi:Peptidase E [uncultured archaeon]|nr:Peptidase E [uncultured archaeon]
MVLGGNSSALLLLPAGFLLNEAVIGVDVMVQKIVAIGGGEIGRPKEGGGRYPVETISIDKEIIRLSGKKHPKVLFLPTASGDSSGYASVVEEHFGKRLGCIVEPLFLRKEKFSKEELEKKVFSSDIIYVGGGNTFKMLRTWKRTGFSKILARAREKGIVLSGVSAGALCWCRFGNSDSRKFSNKNADYIKVNCLGFVNVFLCPHYDVEAERQTSLKKMMKRIPGVAIALENCSALEVVGEKARIITSKKSTSAYKIFWSKGKFFKQKLQKNKWFELGELLSKKRI